jgi:hypothetical protein
MSMIDLANWLGSRGRLGWLVIPAFCLDVRLVRMRERGCFPTKTLAQPRRPCRPRHPYAVPRTFLQCVCTRRRNCIEQLSPFPEYALLIVNIPARNAATIKLTHYPRLGRGSALKSEPERNCLVNSPGRRLWRRFLPAILGELIRGPEDVRSGQSFRALANSSPCRRPWAMP